MPLTVGSRSYDLSARALVVARLDVSASPSAASLCGRAEAMAGEGADILELAGADVGAVQTAVQALAAAVDVPVAVASVRPDVARAGVTAGAVLTACLEVAAETGTSLVIATTEGSVARQAVRAGISPDRIVLDVTPCLRPGPEVLALGYPLLASAGSGCSGSGPGSAGGGDEVRAHLLAQAALAVSTGCRLVRTTDVRSVRRVCVVLAAVLAAGLSHPATKGRS